MGDACAEIVIMRRKGLQKGRSLEKGHAQDRANGSSDLKKEPFSRHPPPVHAIVWVSGREVEFAARDGGSTFYEYRCARPDGLAQRKEVNTLAKPNYGYEKRQKELAKQKKKAEKQQKKLEKAHQPSDEGQDQPQDNAGTPAGNTESS